MGPLVDGQPPRPRPAQGVQCVFLSLSCNIAPLRPEAAWRCSRVLAGGLRGRQGGATLLLTESVEEAARQCLHFFCTLN